jgi:tartrate/fumarate subfamily iron-sulfur-dependent hydro-lyase beta chain
MSQLTKLTIPLDAEAVRKLRVGDQVMLSGTVLTARDMAHLRIKELVSLGKELPEPFSGGVIFHAGPIVRKKDEGFDLLTIGPTTSIRMEPYTDLVGGLGIKAIVGKGGLGDESRRALQKHGMVYLLAAPGCGALHSTAVRRVKTVHWLDDLGMPEAIWVLEVEDWGPLIVGMDSQGNSLFHEIEARGRERIAELYG